MNVVFASDHAGLELKRVLIPFVESLGYETADLGPLEENGEDDYPDFIQLAAKEVSRDPAGVLGVILGGSGQGEAMVANRFPHVRAAVYYGGATDLVKLSRAHNNANILSLGARFITPEDAKAAVKLWLETPFSEEERHARRLKKLEDIWPY